MHFYSTPLYSFISKSYRLRVANSSQKVVSEHLCCPQNLNLLQLSRRQVSLSSIRCIAQLGLSDKQDTFIIRVKSAIHRSLRKISLQRLFLWVLTWNFLRYFAWHLHGQVCSGRRGCKPFSESKALLKWFNLHFYIDNQSL